MNLTGNHAPCAPLPRRKMRCVLPRQVLVLLAWCVLGLMSPCTAEDAVVLIPEAEIVALRKELSEGARESSAAQGRRACKSVIRQGRALLTASPDAANRFEVLGLIHDGQRQLLSLENTEENRTALFTTAVELHEAPDEFVELRLGADLLLMEKAMSEQRATTAVRSKALEELLASYSGTAAEWKGLIIGSMIATKLLDLDLVARIKDRMHERFSGDHRTIQHWRSENDGSQFDAVFQGAFNTVKGDVVSLPFDCWGRPYLAFFWSEKTPRIDDYLREIKELQASHSGGLQVISFNLDELPDAGAKKLQTFGPDWTALLLPGGRENPIYRAYAGLDPQAFIVNAQGRVLLDSPPKALDLTAIEGAPEEGPRPRTVSELDWQPDDDRYLAQLRSLFTGDFLVADAPASRSIRAEVMQPIQACFVPPPLRYRLSHTEELANYRKAVALCDAAIAAHPDAVDLWMIHNRKIIALIGMWNSEGGVGQFCAARGRCGDQITHLDIAVREAELLLGKKLPPGADVVARFCLAKKGMRYELLLLNPNLETPVTKFLATCGGDKAPGSALAAATMLALEGNARSAHQAYRERLLALGDTIDPGLLPVRAFLLDRHHRHRNFYAVAGGLEEWKGKYGFRNMLSGLSQPLDRNTRVSLALKSPDGRGLTLPKDTPGRMLGVVFAEPPADADARGKLIDRAKAFANTFKNHGVDAVVALLTDDIKVVKAVVPEDNAFQVALVPGGLANPLVQKLGILSADRMPNVLLFRADGTVAWAISGLSYRFQRKQEGPDLPMTQAIGNNIEKAKSDLGFEALERGEYKTALKQFDAFIPQYKKGDWWFTDRTHGRALAHMGLEDWESALTTIDAAIAQRMKPGVCKCHGVVEMLLTKAMILDRIGRGREAGEARALADQEHLPHARFPSGAAFRAGIPVGVYYDWLARIRLGMEAASAKATK